MNGIEAFSQEANGKDHGPPDKNGQKNDENGFSQPIPPITIYNLHPPRNNLAKLSQNLTQI